MHPRCIHIERSVGTRCTSHLSSARITASAGADNSVVASCQSCQSCQSFGPAAGSVGQYELGPPPAEAQSDKYAPHTRRTQHHLFAHEEVELERDDGPHATSIAHALGPFIDCAPQLLPAAGVARGGRPDLARSLGRSRSPETPSLSKRASHSRTITSSRSKIRAISGTVNCRAESSTARMLACARSLCRPRDALPCGAYGAPHHSTL